MKKILKLIAAFILMVSLTGCMKIRYDIVIEDEKTANGEMTILIKDEEMTEELSDEELVKQFTEGKNSDWEAKAIHETIDNVKYSGIKAVVPEKDSNEILESLEFKDGVYTLTLANNTINNPIGGEDLEFSLKDLEAMGLEMTITITMPGKIEKAEIGKVDGNSVTITLKEMGELNGSAKIISKESSSNTMLYVGVGAAVLIVAGAVFLVMKKKRAKDTEVASNEEIIDNNETVEQDSNE